MIFTKISAALIMIRCDSFLEQRGISESLLKFPSLSSFAFGLNDNDLNRWAKVTDRIYGEPKTKKPETKKPAAKKTKKTDNTEKAEIDPCEERYLKALDLIGGNVVCQTLLDLSIALFLFPEFGAYLTKNFGYSVCIHLAFLLEGIESPAEEDIRFVLKGAKKFFYINEKETL